MVKNEIEILRLVRHPNIVKCYDFFEMTNDEGEELIVIIEEYCSRGTLLQLVNKGILNEENKREIMFSLTKVVAHIHEKGVAHCDIKLENVLIDENFNLKLSDFGLSKNMNKNYSETRCGTKEYAAPEMYNRGKIDFFKTDIYSLAVAFYLIEVKAFPYPDVKKLKRSFEVFFKNKKLRNILNKCFQILPGNRPSAKELLMDEYFAAEIVERDANKKDTQKTLIDLKITKEIVH